MKIMPCLDMKDAMQWRASTLWTKRCRWPGKKCRLVP